MMEVVRLPYREKDPFLGKDSDQMESRLPRVAKRQPSIENGLNDSVLSSNPTQYPDKETE